MQIQSRKQGFKEIVTYKKVLDINKQSYLIISLDVLWFATVSVFSLPITVVSVSYASWGWQDFHFPKICIGKAAPGETNK